MNIIGRPRTVSASDSAGLCPLWRPNPITAPAGRSNRGSGKWPRIAGRRTRSSQKKRAAACAYTAVALATQSATSSPRKPSSRRRARTLVRGASDALARRLHMACGANGMPGCAREHKIRGDRCGRACYGRPPPPLGRQGGVEGPRAAPGHRPALQGAAARPKEQRERRSRGLVPPPQAPRSPCAECRWPLEHPEVIRSPLS